MARKPKAAEQDSTPAVPDTDVLPESQQPEQTEAPPFEVDNQPSEVTAEEATILPKESKAADITTDSPKEAQAPEPISFEAFKAAQEAAAEMPSPQQEQPTEEDTRQEWEKPLAEIEAEQQPKRRGRPPKEDKDTSGQVGPKSEKPEKAPKKPKAEKAAKPPNEEKTTEPPAPLEPEKPPEPLDATRPGEVEQIVYLKLSELHPFKDHPFQVKEDEEMQAMVSSVKDKGVTQPAIVRPLEDGGYELVSGHRRHRASELAGMFNMPCIEVQRGMTTSSTAIFVPFLTQELRMDGQAVYYGMNALSHNVIMANRKKLKNPNGLFLGVPGSGKSFAAKRELLNVFLATNDNIIVVDPMGEYSPLIKRLGGQVIEIAPSSPHHINPLDIWTESGGDENPMALKSDFILSLCELIVGGKDGLQPVERTIIDRCTRLVYRDYLMHPDTAAIPTLQDLHTVLCDQPEPEAKRLATALEIYVCGSLNVFNHPTNVNLDSRVVCLDLKQLGAGLRTIAMLIMQDLVWSKVSQSFAQHIATWCYFDEFHQLLADELTASYCVTIWKMLRKKGCVPSALTQNVKDFLASRAVENILENSDFMVMLSQAQGDRQILAKQLGISPHQLSYVTHSGSGEGLLFFGNVTIPFVDRFPQGTEIYSLLTTKPEDRADETE